MSETAAYHIFELCIVSQIEERGVIEIRGRERTYPNFRCESPNEGGLRNDVCCMYSANDANQDAHRENGKDHDSLILGQLHTP